MGKIKMDLYLKTLRWRYHHGNRAVKKRMLDDFCETYGYHRKAAARLLRQLPISDKNPQKAGKKKTNEPGILLEPLKKIWLATDQMCGKRLKQALPLWLPYYSNHHEGCHFSKLMSARCKFSKPVSERCKKVGTITDRSKSN